METCCDRFREERVELAVREIGRRGAQKIRDGDVVVAYGYADAVEALFGEAVGRNFEVVVVDSAPAFAGRRLLNALYAKRVRTTHVRPRRRPRKSNGRRSSCWVRTRSSATALF